MLLRVCVRMQTLIMRSYFNTYTRSYANRCDQVRKSQRPSLRRIDTDTQCLCTRFGEARRYDGLVRLWGVGLWAGVLAVRLVGFSGVYVLRACLWMCLWALSGTFGGLGTHTPTPTHCAHAPTLRWTMVLNAGRIPFPQHSNTALLLASTMMNALNSHCEQRHGFSGSDSEIPPCQHNTRERDREHTTETCAPLRANMCDAFVLAFLHVSRVYVLETITNTLHRQYASCRCLFSPIQWCA